MRYLTLIGIATAHCLSICAAQESPEDVPQLYARLSPKASIDSIAFSADDQYLMAFDRQSCWMYERTESEYALQKKFRSNVGDSSNKGLFPVADASRAIGIDSRNVATIKLAPPATPQVLSVETFDDSKLLYHAKLASDGKTLATYYYSGKVNVIDIATKKVTEITDVWPASINDLCLSCHAGQLLVLQNERVTLYDVQTSKPIQMVENEAFDHDSRFEMRGRAVLCFSGHSPRKAHLVNLRTGKETSIVQVTDSRVTYVTKDGEWFIEIHDKTAYCHSFNSSLRHTIELGGGRRIHSFASVAEGNRSPIVALAAGYADIFILKFPEKKQDGATISEPDASLETAEDSDLS